MSILDLDNKKNKNVMKLGISWDQLYRELYFLRLKATVLQLTVPRQFLGLLCSCVSGFLYCVYVVIVCSSSLIILVPREGLFLVYGISCVSSQIQRAHDVYTTSH